MFMGNPPKCPSCNGTGTQDLEWPPVKGQVFYITLGNDAFNPLTTDRIKMEGEHIFICDVYNVWHPLSLCFPTLKMAEEYLAWRKERGI